MPGKLTALAVTRAKERGTYGDGGGLYLQIARGGTKTWILRYKHNGKTRHLGLGPLAVVGLREARQRAVDARRLLLDGHDPIERKSALRNAEKLKAIGTMSFDQCATEYIKSHRAEWRSSKHANDWVFSLKTYASPVLGALPVRAITTALIMRVLESIWTTKSETASRVRGRIEAILDWAKARGNRDGENPARLKGHLDHLLPDRKKVRKVEHYAALPYVEIGGFMSELRRQDGTAARALEFLILTAARSGELLKARWSEIEGSTWVIPAAHTKIHKEHRVPLSQRAIDILVGLPRINDIIFAGHRIGQGLGGDAMIKVLRGISTSRDVENHPLRSGENPPGTSQGKNPQDVLRENQLTVHGFRSTFRDWAAECTAFPNEVCEAALAHAVKGKTEAAYRRGDLFEKRVRLMEVWASFCSGDFTIADVTPIRGVS
jgi:integrase